MGEDGSVGAWEARGPLDRRIDEATARWAGDRFVLLGFEFDAEGPPWIATVSPDGSHDWIELSPPPGASSTWQIVVRPDGRSVLVLAAGSDASPPPRVAEVSVAPLALPREEDWIDLPGPYAPSDRVWPSLHETGAGLVLSEFVTPRGATLTSLRLQWLDASLRAVASWSIETGSRGHAGIIGAPPAQEIFLTLPDEHGDLDGLATIFHARASSPGVVSTPSAIGRTRGFRPPDVVIDADGRARTVHFDDRIDVERVCEVP